MSNGSHCNTILDAENDIYVLEGVVSHDLQSLLSNECRKLFENEEGGAQTSTTNPQLFRMAMTESVPNPEESDALLTSWFDMPSLSEVSSDRQSFSQAYDAFSRDPTSSSPEQLCAWVHRAVTASHALTISDDAIRSVHIRYPLELVPPAGLLAAEPSADTDAADAATATAHRVLAAAWLYMGRQDHLAAPAPGLPSVPPSGRPRLLCRQHGALDADAAPADGHDGPDADADAGGHDSLSVSVLPSVPAAPAPLTALDVGLRPGSLLLYRPRAHALAHGPLAQPHRPEDAAPAPAAPSAASLLRDHQLQQRHRLRGRPVLALRVQYLQGRSPAHADGRAPRRPALRFIRPAALLPRRLDAGTPRARAITRTHTRTH
jgi:hypothetical protein